DFSELFCLRLRNCPSCVLSQRRARKELYEVPGGDLRLPPGRPCARGRAVRWRLEHLLSLQWVESDLLCEYPLLCGAMTTQFCTSSTSTLYAMSYPVSSFPSSSWRRRARRLRLAMFRQALFDIHTLQCVPVGAQSPEVVQSPAVVQSPEIRVLEALGVMTESFDGVAKPDGPTDRGKAFSSYYVAYSPDAVQSLDGVLGSVSFLPGVQNEELQDSMASHPGSSTTGRLSNAVVSSAVTEDECQAARDWALPVSMSAPFGVSYTDSRDRSFSVGLRLFMHTGCKWELKVPRRMICNKGVLRVLLPGVH
ncbi:unnamed protein product, partial [Prorocentrum cordatum]